MAERDRNTLYSLIRERLKSGEAMTRAGAFADAAAEKVSGAMPGRIPIERDPTDSPATEWVKQGARNMVSHGENLGAFGDSFNAKGIEYGNKIVDAVKRPFQAPSTGIPNLEYKDQPKAPLADAPVVAAPSQETPAQAAPSPAAPVEIDFDPNSMSDKDLKKAADDATADWKKRVKNASSKQKKEAVKILEKDGIDIEKQFENIAPEMKVLGLNKEEQGWFLMEFGLRLMAEGSKPGATAGSSFGAAGVDTLGSVKLHNKEKARKEGGIAAAAEDTRRWTAEYKQKNVEMLAKSLADDPGLKLSSKLTVDGYMPAINPKTGEASFVTGEDGKPLRFESDAAASKAISEANRYATNNASQISRRLEANNERSMGYLTPEESAKVVADEIAVQNQMLGAFGPGAAKAQPSGGTTARLPPASQGNKGKMLRNDETGEIFVSDGKKWVISKTQ